MMERLTFLLVLVACLLQSSSALAFLDLIGFLAPISVLFDSSHFHLNNLISGSSIHTSTILNAQIPSDIAASLEDNPLKSLFESFDYVISKNPDWGQPASEYFGNAYEFITSKIG